MSEHPFFSVIIPTHNGEDRIGRAIDSCLTQTFHDYEIIVVCDDCTDDTIRTVSRRLSNTYDGHDDYLIIEANHHRDGLSRNDGIDAAHGKYILFLDDDDWFLHEFVFQQMHDLLKNADFDVLNYAIIWRTVGYRADPPGVFIPMVAGHVWRREFIADTRFDDGQYSSDLRFLQKMIDKEPDGIWTALPMYYYNYLRPGSLSDLHKRGEIE